MFKFFKLNIQNLIKIHMFIDPVTVINNRMSTDSIGSEFSLDDSSKCDNRIPRSHSLHDARTLNSEPMSEEDDDDDDNDNALLEQCINAGIENITTSNIIDDEELPDDVQEELLSQCIAAGIKMPTTCKSQMPVKIKTKKQNVNDINEEKQQQDLLESGIRNNKKSFKNKCDDLSDSEQEEALLKECIAAGMRKLQKNKSKEINDDTLELNEEDLLNSCINQGVRNVARKQREIPVFNKYKKLFAPKSDSEFSESTSTMTPGGVINGIKKLDESNDSTWKDDETLTFSTLTSSYQSANTGENSKSKLIPLDKGEIGNVNYNLQKRLDI